MPQDSFQLECDRLSHIVDGALFERLRWERNEGPMLARLVALAHSAFEGDTHRFSGAVNPCFFRFSVESGSALP